MGSRLFIDTDILIDFSQDKNNAVETIDELEKERNSIFVLALSLRWNYMRVVGANKS